MNGADFYDLVGPTKTSLKGYAVGVGYNRTLVYDQPRQLDLKAGVTYYGNLDRVPDYQGIPTNFTDELATRARLSYQALPPLARLRGRGEGRRLGPRLRRRPREGRRLRRFYGNLDLGTALPIRHSSVWLRTSAGWSPGDREEPFANFYFGGFRNNWVDWRDEKRYRESYAFPGLEINEVGGTQLRAGDARVEPAARCASAASASPAST